jgi:ribose transport system permease protein
MTDDRNQPQPQKDGPAQLARPVPGSGRLGGIWDGLKDCLGLLTVLGALIVVFSLATDHFFSLPTFRMMANLIPESIIVAVGMTYVLIIAGIDLSVGSVLALSSAAMGVAIVEYGWPIWAGMLLCVGVGLGCGLFNGLVTIGWRLPSFIVTLGMLEMARGLTYLVTQSDTKFIGPDIQALAQTSCLGLSAPFLIALTIVALGQLVLWGTVFGRHMVAIGTNEEAVRLSGIDPRPVKLAVFVLCGLLVSVASLMHTSRTGSADPNDGGGLELQAIAAVVIGGTSLMGGRGSVFKSLLGVLIIEVLGAGLAQVGASSHAKRLITGGLIVVAVIFDYYRQRLRTART